MIRVDVVGYIALGQLRCFQDDRQLLGLVFDRDNVADFAAVGRNIHKFPIHLDVAMIYGLPCSGTSVSKTEAVNHIIKPKLKKLEEDLTGDTTLAGCFVEVFAELP